MNKAYNKYGLNQDFLKCKCGKPSEKRQPEWMKEENRKYGRNQFVIPYRGPNNTELCCKCAKNICSVCQRKGKRRVRRPNFEATGNANNGYYRDYRRVGDDVYLEDMINVEEKDPDNPSGAWNVYYCNEHLPTAKKEEHERINNETRNNHEKEIGWTYRLDDQEMVWESGSAISFDEQYFKPNPSAEGRPNPSSNSENWSKYCNYCGKFTEVKFGNTKNEKTFCSRDCYVAAGNEIQKGKCRIAGCSREAYYECMDLCLSHSRPCKGGRIKPDGKRCNAAMGVDEEEICEFCRRNEDNPYKPNPAAPAPQSITNSDSTSEDNEVKVNPSNSPKPNPGKDEYSETKNNFKTIKFENKESEGKNPVNPALEKSSNKTDNETLIINLNNVEKISLNAEGNLVIEFKKEQQGNYWDSISQTITLDQIKSSQELQKVKNYLEKNNQKGLNQQELNRILSKNNNSVSPEKPKDSNNIFLIGSIMFGTLIIGIGIGLLLLRRKRKIKKFN